MVEALLLFAIMMCHQKSITVDAAPMKVFPLYDVVLRAHFSGDSAGGSIVYFYNHRHNHFPFKSCSSSSLW